MGEVLPDRVVTSAAGGAGDALVLPKPLGAGVLPAALKRALLPGADVAPAVAAMTTLNAGAARAMLGVGVHAATDVTGFGLLAHRRTMPEASGAAPEVRAAAVPLLPHAREAAERGAIPGGTERNAAGVAAAVSFAAGVDRTARLLLADAQTSGGLLIAVAAERADMLVAALRREATPAADVIGRVVTGVPGTMTVV